jgi:hypothetical protein
LLTSSAWLGQINFYSNESTGQYWLTLSWPRSISEEVLNVSPDLGKFVILEERNGKSLRQSDLRLRKWYL